MDPRAAFVAAHLAESRYYLLKVLGQERPNPLAKYLGFLVQHDSYHVGQLPWLHKHAGLPAKKYS